jgi:hypothetical protein
MKLLVLTTQGQIGRRLARDIVSCSCCCYTVRAHSWRKQSVTAAVSLLGRYILMQRATSLTFERPYDAAVLRSEYTKCFVSQSLNLINKNNIVFVF